MTNWYFLISICTNMLLLHKNFNMPSHTSNKLFDKECKQVIMIETSKMYKTYIAY